jgi:hypothetical protein
VPFPWIIMHITKSSIDSTLSSNSVWSCWE